VSCPALHRQRNRDPPRLASPAGAIGSAGASGPSRAAPATPCRYQRVRLENEYYTTLLQLAEPTGAGAAGGGAVLRRGKRASGEGIVSPDASTKRARATQSSPLRDVGPFQANGSLLLGGWPGAQQQQQQQQQQQPIVEHVVSMEA